MKKSAHGNFRNGLPGINSVWPAKGGEEGTPTSGNSIRKFTSWIGWGVSPAFTLIELLTVISIIGLLAGLVIGLAPGVQKSMRVKRVQADLNQIATALEDFKAKYGHYPPDNRLSTTPLVVDPTINQLYYELTGWVYNSVGNGRQSLARGGVLYSATVQYYFHQAGFVNSAGSAAEVKNFLPNLKTNQVAQYPWSGAPQVELLKVPVPGPNGEFNTWRYVSSSPTNNPGKFDLWAEIMVGREKLYIGNWKNNMPQNSL